MRAWFTSRVLPKLRRFRPLARLRKVEQSVQFFENGLSACPGCGVILITGHERVIRYVDANDLVNAACRRCGPELRSLANQQRAVRERAAVTPPARKSNGRPHVAT